MDKKLLKLGKTASEYLKKLVLALWLKLIWKKKVFSTFHLIYEMETAILTKSQVTAFFTFIMYETTNQTSSGKWRIPSKRDCRKTLLMRRYATQQNVNAKVLWRKVGSKLILNTSKINEKNQKIDLEILFDLTHHSTNQYPQILKKYFLDWSIDIFQSVIDYIKFSTVTQWKLAAAVSKICPK